MTLGFHMQGLKLSPREGWLHLHQSTFQVMPMSLEVEPDAPVAHMPVWLYDLLEPKSIEHKSQLSFSPGKFFSEIMPRDITWLWKDRIHSR